MNDHDNPTAIPSHGVSHHREMDLTALVTALVLLGVAAIGVNSGTWWLIPNLMPWAVAGAVALVGLGLIVSTLPRRRRR